MKKIDKVTPIAVILALVIAYFLLPTEIGINVNVEGKPVNSVVTQSPVTEAAKPQTTVPQTTQPEATKPAEDNKTDEGTKTDKPESVKEIIDQYTLLVDKFNGLFVIHRSAHRALGDQRPCEHHARSNSDQNQNDIID